MNFLGSLPARYFFTFVLAKAILFTSSSDNPLLTLILSRNFPLTWRTRVINSSAKTASSYFGHDSKWMDFLFFNTVCQSSSARCGANGARSFKKVPYCFLLTHLSSMALSSFINPLTPVLNFKFLTSSPISFVYLLSIRSTASSLFWGSSNLPIKPQTRFKNLAIPLKLFEFQAKSCSNGPKNAKFIRTVSAPYLASSASGSPTLPRDLDMRLPSGPIITPWLRRDRNGSENSTAPKLFKALVIKRAYKRCMVLCSRPPIYNGTGSHSLIFSFEANAFLLFGSV